MFWPGVVGYQGCIGGPCWAAAYCVVDDAYIAEPWFLPAEPDRGGAVGPGLNAAWGHWRGVHGWRCCDIRTHYFPWISQDLDMICHYSLFHSGLNVNICCINLILYGHTLAKRSLTSVEVLLRPSLPHHSSSINLLVKCPNWGKTIHHVQKLAVKKSL